ncbi:MAG: hypothetical protein QGF00_00700 [Planctomycetota bacterium]|nr:hypothetical protein [Planctomycetota bacterium]
MKDIPKTLSGILLLLLSTACAEEQGASVQHKRGVYTIANRHFSIVIDSTAGARIRSWKLKSTGREMIAFWKGANEIGGALDDRTYFTAAMYKAAVIHPGPETVRLRCAAIHPSGMKVIKILAVHRDKPVLDVHTTYENGTQAERRIFIRNFFMPGTQPQTDKHLYWVNGIPTRGKKEPVIADPKAHGYFDLDKLPYAALWDSETGDGIMALAPGWDQFYFWRGSKVFPTFEWLFSALPAGKKLVSHVRLVAVDGQKNQPDWIALAAENLKKVRAARLYPIDNWIDEATRFNVTEAERAQGYWLSMGEDKAKQRLPERIDLDLPLRSRRFITITVNALKTEKMPIKVELPENWRSSFDVSLQTEGKIRRELLPLPETPVSLKSGMHEKIWLDVKSDGRAAGEYDIPIMVHVGESKAKFTLRLKVWPVDVNIPRPFHVRGYCGGFPVWTGGFDMTEKKLARLEGILKTYAAIGGNVLDWNTVWYQVVRKARLAGTEDILAEIAAKHPERIDLENLPDLDFSYFDPWFELARKHGVTRVESYMSPPSNSQWQWRLLDSAVGKKRVKFNTPDGNKVIVWFFDQMRRYLAAKGFTGLFCKISDEISPGYIPAYKTAAVLVQKAGWRPFTTITGLIARTGKHINAMNPVCDLWQLSFGLKDDFLDRIGRNYTLDRKTIELKGKWGKYTNGGAKGCWAIATFGEDSVTGFAPADVEEFRLLEDGKPIRLMGGSPWGKTAPGTAYTAGSIQRHLYVIPADGRKPDDHKYELTVSLRKPSPDGKPLASIDPIDEVWCYGGGSRPYRGTYHRAWIYPVMTLHHGFRGYGLWAFFHWNQTEKIMWIDDETLNVTVSPAYCGYRDGWQDARLFKMLSLKKGRPALDNIVGSDESPLHVDFNSHEVYRYKTVVNAYDPVAMNKGRRQALSALSK